MDLSMHLLELAQTHVHWVGDVIQPSWVTEYESVLVVMSIRNGPAAVSGSCQFSRGFQDYQPQLSESVSQRTGISALNQRNRTIWYVGLEAEASIGPDLVTVEAKTHSLNFRLSISSSLFQCIINFLGPPSDSQFFLHELLFFSLALTLW